MRLLESRRGRVLLFGALYFSEGAPMGYLWWTLPVRLGKVGWSEDDVGTLVASLALPWTLKFLASPLADALSRRRMGLKAWVLGAQFAMIACLLPLMFGEGAPLARPSLVALLVVHSLCAATQDVGIDALAVRATPDAEHGLVNAAMQAGLMAGRLLIGVVSITVMDSLGDRGALAILAAGIALPALLLAGTRMPRPDEFARPEEASLPFFAGLAHVFRERATWLGLAVAVTAGFSYEYIGQLSYHLGNLGAGTDDLARMPLVNLILLAAGGLLAPRIAMRRTRQVVAGTVFTVLASLILAGIWSSTAPRVGFNAGIAAAIALLYFFIGMLTVWLYAFFMDLAAGRTAPATRFSLFMAGTNLCETISSAAAGRIALTRGFPATMLLLAPLGLIALIPLRFIGARRATHPS